MPLEHGKKHTSCRAGTANGEPTGAGGTSIIGIATDSVSVLPASLSLSPGDEQQISATLTPANASLPVAWSSNQEAIATVTIAKTVGVTVTAIAPGTAIITAASGGQSASCTVTVHDAHAPGGSSGPATYPPIVTDTKNGTVAFTPAAPIWGQRVTITPKPDEGFAVDSVTVTDRNGDPISVTDNQNGTWSFTQPSGRVTITVTFRPTAHVCPSESFTDVDQAAWYHAAVDYMVETGLMRGTSATTFSPAAETSRGMIAAILWRLEGEPAAGESGFADVASQMYYAEAIAWAKENGIVNGVDATQFQPDRAITREELAAILYRYAEYKGYDTTGCADLSGYSDAGIISPYAVEAMQWAHAKRSSRA